MIDWMIIFWILVLCISIYVLIKSSDKFTEKTEALGLHFGLSPFIIGVTIVAFGTSLPELISSIFAMVSGSSEIVIGNAVGSNITNILLIIGVAGLFAKKNTLNSKNYFDFVYLLGSALLMWFFLRDSVFNLYEAIISVLLLCFYLIKSVKSKKDVVEDSSVNKNSKFGLMFWSILILSGVGIYYGAEYVVTSVVKISEIFSIPKEIISASVVALGTSLPELSVSVVAAKKGKLDLAVGNVLGSNIFNLFGVIGISGLIGSISITPVMLTFQIPAMVISTAVFLFIINKKKITKLNSVLLLVMYAIYLFLLFT